MASLETRSIAGLPTLCISLRLSRVHDFLLRDKEKVLCSWCTGLSSLTPGGILDRGVVLSMQIAAGRTVNEVEVDEFLTGQRRSQPGFIEPSFPTIAGGVWVSTPSIHSISKSAIPPLQHQNISLIGDQKFVPPATLAPASGPCAAETKGQDGSRSVDAQSAKALCVPCGTKSIP